ncbi:hypothetical protein BT67DRAFT_457291 [Trichocladium antarcticum]|uniref:Uncharacterized protein n=1 Tax=Trichocladium antarcticum TaxID=1450529 RepID=A0AAN6UGR8_9PEZI|nr:hypothetical protein BT67DRAFT_457291 [Trichocladium antarcticum]
MANYSDVHYNILVDYLGDNITHAALVINPANPVYHEDSDAETDTTDHEDHPRRVQQHTWIPASADDDDDDDDANSPSGRGPRIANTARHNQAGQARLAGGANNTSHADPAGEGSQDSHYDPDWEYVMRTINGGGLGPGLGSLLGAQATDGSNFESDPSGFSDLSALSGITECGTVVGGGSDAKAVLPPQDTSAVVLEEGDAGSSMFGGDGDEMDVDFGMGMGMDLDLAMEMELGPEMDLGVGLDLAVEMGLWGGVDMEHRLPEESPTYLLLEAMAGARARARR